MSLKMVLNHISFEILENVEKIMKMVLKMNETRRTDT